MTARTDRIPEGYVPAKTSAEQALEYHRLAQFLCAEVRRNVGVLIFPDEMFSSIVRFYARGGRGDAGEGEA